MSIFRMANLSGKFVWAPVLTVTIALVPFTSVQGAEDIAGKIEALMKGARDIQVRAPIIKKEANEARNEMKKLDKEKALYEGQIKNRLRPIFRKLANDMRNHNDKKEKFNKAINGFNSRCARIKLPPTQLQRCKNEKRSLSNWSRKLDINKKEILKQHKSALRQRKTYYVRLAKIVKLRQKHFDIWFKRTIEYNKLRIRLQDSMRRLKRDCATAMRRARDPRDRNGREALKYCHSMNWDGARVNLPEFWR